MVDTATGFVTACMQLSTEVETLEHIAAQTCAPSPHRHSCYLALTSHSQTPSAREPGCAGGGGEQGAAAVLCVRVNYRPVLTRDVKSDWSGITTCMTHAGAFSAASMSSRMAASFQVLA